MFSFKRCQEEKGEPLIVLLANGDREGLGLRLWLGLVLEIIFRNLNTRYLTLVRTFFKVFKYICLLATFSILMHVAIV